MRAKHVTSDSAYRNPFGAAPVGGAITLAIDVWDESNAKAELRLWVEESEKLLPMDGVWQGDHLRFSVTFIPSKPGIIWYSFNITAEAGDIWRYGAATEHGCGEGAFAYGYPPSFQITVYERQRKVQPDWYKNGIVYQIFPDRFFRGSDWRERAHDKLDAPHAGIPQRLIEDWDTPVSYQRNGDGSIASWDFYGGTLEGIRGKLPYLESMGVTVIYLNPIFEAQSNHRYDTGDYLKIDPMLGDADSFKKLCADAKARGISVVLDGVFNHTGVDSRYFNLFGNYPGVGAGQDASSPYRDWYRFNEDGGYASWWGVGDLPSLNQSNTEFRDLICGRDGVVRSWIRAGARGWRLDVADELSDSFIGDIKSAELAERDDALLIGEVWEDATNKIAYGKLRQYFEGAELDGTMNYPFRRAALDYVTRDMNAYDMAAHLESLYENYPHDNLYCCLNLLGSHDRTRLLTILGDAPAADTLSDDQRRNFRLNEGQRSLAVSRLWVITLLQMTLPGVPCIYYGDEAGMEGYADPYNRGPYPWDDVDQNCRTIYRNAIALRKTLPVLTDGSFEPFAIDEDVFGFWRRNDEESVCVLINSSLNASKNVSIPMEDELVDDVVSGRVVPVEDGQAKVFMWPLGTSVLYFHRAQLLQAPMERGMGVLCHITSVPNADRPGQPGTLGEPVKRFIDYLAEAGMRYWQVLPVNPTDHYGSPYAGLSAFAGNTALMWGAGKDGSTTSFPTDFEGTPEYRRFVEENEEWLLPYAAFRTIKGLVGEKPWQEWPAEYREWSPKLARRKELRRGVQHECAVQFEFMRQWNEMHEYAKKRGIAIIGDMPMYVSADSSDVWADRHMFQLDENGYPAEQAGCPPDAFAADGQLWGNPTYDWHFMRDDGYEWWMRRLERAFQLYDYVRLDHFLGFSSYYSIPNGKGPKEGSWRFGPGLDLFKCAYERFGALPVIAEDLGTVTPAVRALVSATGFAGMDVIQFSDEDVRNAYTPKPGKVVYSSTHDTNTLVGWCQERFGSDQSDGSASQQSFGLARGLLDRALATEADVVIVPLQDVLMLDASSRMNVPGVATGNWSWQATTQQVEDSAATLREIAEKSGRAARAADPDAQKTTRVESPRERG